MQEVVSKLSTIEARVADEQKLLQSRFDSNCEAIKNEMVEQHHLWEALSRSNVETGNLWKAAELATREIGNLWQRVEFVRSEILYEIKYGLDRGHANSDPAVASSEMSRALEPQIRNPKLIDEAPPEGFKVNLGCGHLARAGYVNVDARHLPGVDVVADLGNLPFSKKSVGEFFSGMIII